MWWWLPRRRWTRFLAAANGHLRFLIDRKARGWLVEGHVHLHLACSGVGLVGDASADLVRPGALLAAME